jgi:hypothetical protein
MAAIQPDSAIYQITGTEWRKGKIAVVSHARR